MCVCMFRRENETKLVSFGDYHLSSPLRYRSYTKLHIVGKTCPPSLTNTRKNQAYCFKQDSPNALNKSCKKSLVGLYFIHEQAKGINKSRLHHSLAQD